MENKKRKKTNLNNKEIISVLNNYYQITFIKLRLKRRGGNLTYFAYTEKEKYFLKIINEAFKDTFIQSIEICTYLQENNVNIPNIIKTKNDLSYISIEINQENYYLVLYEYLELKEVNVIRNSESIGKTIGLLHHVMKSYKGDLKKHDKSFYIDRYINILKKKNFDKVDEYITYADYLWNRIKDLPRGYSHGDMYSGNINKTSNGLLYIFDFDTSCIGFSIYDLALICNQTNYFTYDDNGIYKTKEVYEKMLPEYEKISNTNLSKKEKDSLYDMIALYHYALQATIIEIYGLDCVNNQFFDNQLKWLYKWDKQKNEIFKEGEK